VSHPHWLIVNFGQSRTISRFFALCEQVAVFSVPANWQFQVDVAGAWVTVVTGVATDQWVLSGVFTSVATTRVRLLVTQNNDGWFRIVFIFCMLWSLLVKKIVLLVMKFEMN
jgi:hypothetical protein